MNIPKDISTLYRKMNARINVMLADIGLSGSKALFLFCINEHGPMTQKDICDRLDMDKSSVAKMLVRLEKDGFIIKERHDEDARAYNVRLTEKALALIPQALKIQNEWLEEVTKIFNQSEKNEFFRFIEQAADSANKIV